MEKVEYKQLKETIYKEVLPNGLTVILLPKPDFHKTYALFSTDFGSIDQRFIPINETEPVKMPDGIAHFLEHKMFEKEEGDVFNLFSTNGASANAFTGYTKTAYLFSATSQIQKNIETLLDFVQIPYFTEKSVEKEKGIISQEIQMYDDMPEWRVMFGLLENLYPNHPASIDIAGTVDSIEKITAEQLYKNYTTFYHPNNMQIFVIGKIEPEETLKWIKDNQAMKTFEAPQEIKRFFPEAQSIVPFNSIQLPVVKPKLLIGMKGNSRPASGRRALKQVILVEFLLKLLFGETSSTYLKLYDEGLIDESFNYDYTLERELDHLSVGGDTKAPDELAAILKSLLLTAADSPELNEEHFQIVKRRSIGQVLQSLNSLEYIAHHFSEHQFEDTTVFDIVPLMESVELKEVKEMAGSYMAEDQLSEFRIMPEAQE